MRTQKLILSIIFFIVSNAIYAQANITFIIPDTLKNMSFQELEKKYMNTISVKTKSYYYGNTYYKKSKRQKDKIIIANGMYMMAYLSSSTKEKIALQYADSIISLTKNFEDFNYPAKGYIAKGHFLMKNTDFKEALANTLIAEKHSIKSVNYEQNLLIKQQIGLIKIELGNLNEALQLFKENYDYFKTKKTVSREYIFSGWVLSDIYIRYKNPDVALKYINELLSKIKSDNLYYRYLIMYKGICYHLKSEYVKSNEFLDKSIILLIPHETRLNLTIAYYYRGENILKSEHNVEKAKSYFKKVDSILVITKEYIRDLRNNYIRLIEIAKKQKDDKEQLHYLNRLIEIDDYLKKKNEGLSQSINNNYDTPHLLAQKEQVISNMNKEKDMTIIIVVISFIGIGLLFLFYFIKSKQKNLRLEERFNSLMQQTKNTSNSQLPQEAFIDVVKQVTKTKSNEVPKEIEAMIIKKLDLFVKAQGFLKPNIKQTDFAKDFSTNTTYISIVINQNTAKNFNQYINDLRIDYAINKLKEDSSFSKYSVEAIAQEIGFSNTQSFSKAFMVKTGLQPSYFIKKLNENI
jgi:YesN/AraC family two-component response regulator